MHKLFDDKQTGTNDDKNERVAFDQGKIGDYIEQYIKDHKKEHPMDKQTYLTYLEKIRGLKELITTHVRLMMYMTIFPRLMKQYEKEAKERQSSPTVQSPPTMNETTLYEFYVSARFAREEGALMRDGAPIESTMELTIAGDIKDIFWYFCIQLATAMRMAGVDQVLYKDSDSTSPWKKFFGNPVYDLALQAAPLQKKVTAEGTSYSFLDPTLREFFFTKDSPETAIKKEDQLDLSSFKSPSPKK